MKKRITRMAWQTILLTLFIATSVLSNTVHAFEFRGFGDINYADASKDAPTSDSSKTAAFRLGQFSLHAHGDLGENLDAVTEIAFISTSSGITTALARLYIGYTFDEMLKIRAGKWHKPIGYWNNTYHHGTLLQTTIESPLLQRIIPIHETGVWAVGTFQSEPLMLNYGITITNGDQIKGSSLSTNDVSDNNVDKAVLFHLRAHPSLLPALGIGISGNFEKVQIFNSSAALTGRVAQQIYAVDLEYINQQIEFLSEYFLYNNKDEMTNTGTHHSSLWYVQLGYTIANRFIPYARYEKLSLREGDPVFKALSSTPDQQKALVGLRYNMTANSALKAEIQSIDPTDPNADNYWKYAAQWAFAL